MPVPITKLPLNANFDRYPMKTLRMIAAYLRIPESRSSGINFERLLRASERDSQKQK
jgi:hypothetical protein